MTTNTILRDENTIWKCGIFKILFGKWDFFIVEIEIMCEFNLNWTNNYSKILENALENLWKSDDF